MSEPKTRFEWWLGTGVIWQVALVASGACMLYYTRMQALNGEATGREALAKIQAEAKANFEKLETTLRVTHERLAKLEASPLAAKQQEAINSVQARLVELESKYTKPEQVADLRLFGSTLRDENQAWLKKYQTNPTGAPRATMFDPARSLTSFPQKSSFLEGSDKKSLQQLLDDVKLPQHAPFVLHDMPKLDMKVIAPPKPQTTAEVIVNTAKTYWFLIVILLASLFGRKRN
jgi:hypothetical protein